MNITKLTGGLESGGRSVKPKWDKKADPSYIYNQKEIQNRVLLIGNVIDSDKARRYRTGPSGCSDETTTYSGTGQLKYYHMPATDFQYLGTYEDPMDEVSDRIAALMKGVYSNPLSNAILLKTRITE